MEREIVLKLLKLSPDYSDIFNKFNIKKNLFLEIKTNFFIIYNKNKKRNTNRTIKTCIRRTINKIRKK